MERVSGFGRSLAIAFMFLSRIPMPHLKEYKIEDQRRSGLLFPLVGLLLGVLLAVLSLFLSSQFPASVSAAILLCAWVFITGGLHIDGLADSADAWLGGLADKSRSLAIMKDPRCGSGAVFTVICLLLLKYGALFHLFEQSGTGSTNLASSLIIILMLGRCSAIAVFRFCPYVSESGSALGFLDLKKTNVINLALLIYLSLFVLLWPAGLIELGILLLIWLGLRHLMMSRIGGCTGDTAGASVEIIEAAALVLLCSTG
ncbi:adenosylcobinamide-GDP ribazoletransferase [uncultured Pseudoteredinibacter sp.]|uniref:adenosylcobinamide-GDP ribazoletransferase n=1 Tax=uncultured Pseudoteredinibacter sp. TaxID=1641701 RepID=UPI00261439F9|nr:adenosylcobinamide-GDP ribazoletransferase [uncultured Pseudoteredinibacter sp.]